MPRWRSSRVLSRRSTDGFARVILVGHQESIEAELKKYRYPREAITVRTLKKSSAWMSTRCPQSGRRKTRHWWWPPGWSKRARQPRSFRPAIPEPRWRQRCSNFGRLPGVERPGIATVFPSPKGPKVLIDSGANVDVKASHLVQFAYLGSHYASQVLGIGNPRVALLSVGSEATKGSGAVIEAHQALAGAGDLNFTGNVEGREFLTADVDVIVCDGFVGNIALKLAEGIVSTLTGMIRDELKRNPLRMLGGILVKPAFSDIFRRMDYTEYGGAPLLGVNGL